LIHDGSVQVDWQTVPLPEKQLFTFGQVLVRPTQNGGFRLSHRSDSHLERTEDLEKFHDPDDALELSRFDDAGNYRPLKTAPNLRRGWILELRDRQELGRALDHFYPGRLAVLAAQSANCLALTALRETLGRQSGIYRVAATISDAQLDEVVGGFCRSDGGCLRTILWKRDAQGTTPSTRLPAEKFDPAHDQATAGGPPITDSVHVPLLCQEACNLLVGECRKVVKSG
jgi:sirohydrochlorin cobaltochelatase